MSHTPAPWTVALPKDGASDTVHAGERFTIWLGSTGASTKDRSALFTCVSCDARFIITSDTKVMFR